MSIAKGTFRIVLNRNRHSCEFHTSYPPKKLNGLALQFYFRADNSTFIEPTKIRLDPAYQVRKFIFIGIYFFIIHFGKLSDVLHQLDPHPPARLPPFCPPGSAKREDHTPGLKLLNNIVNQCFYWGIFLLPDMEG